jgi:hypothetical protein
MVVSSSEWDLDKIEGGRLRKAVHLVSILAQMFSFGKGEI